jgi:hypothetical protein
MLLGMRPGHTCGIPACFVSAHCLTSTMTCHTSCCNPEGTEHDYHMGSEQHAFLQRDLEAVDRTLTPHVIFTGHRPMYGVVTLSLDACRYSFALQASRFGSRCDGGARVLLCGSCEHLYQLTSRVSASINQLLTVQNLPLFTIDVTGTAAQQSERVKQSLRSGESKEMHLTIGRWESH